MNRSKILQLPASPGAGREAFHEKKIAIPSEVDLVRSFSEERDQRVVLVNLHGWAGHIKANRYSERKRGKVLGVYKPACRCMKSDDLDTGALWETYIYLQERKTQTATADLHRFALAAIDGEEGRDACRGRNAGETRR